MYIYIYIGGWGKWVQPGNRLSFSFVRCVRASERSCVCAWESVPPPSRSGELKMSSGARFGSEVFADRCWGFKRFECFLLTVAGVLRDAKYYGCSRLGFYEMYVKTPACGNEVESDLLKPQQITATWVQVSPSQSKWVQVNPMWIQCESKWVQVSPSESKWIQWESK